MKYTCSVCGYVYDEDKGIPERGIPAGTKWEDLPDDDFECPWCSSPKSAFEKNDDDVQEEVSEVENIETEDVDFSELSPMEASIICSNLARGCEKQYKNLEAEAFTRISDYLKKGAEKLDDASLLAIYDKVEEDIGERFKYAFNDATEEGDRGALRALTWSDKVSKMIKSLISQYKKEGEKLFLGKDIYVCTICGFVFVGNVLPEICPVCKVTTRKFVKI